MYGGEDVLGPKRKSRHGECGGVDAKLHTLQFLASGELIIISYMLSYLQPLGRHQSYIWDILYILAPHNRCICCAKERQIWPIRRKSHSCQSLYCLAYLRHGN